MYVTTFYSYKGGVGRTLALLNVAYELADSGQNVLVVDFDLEAPAIHSGTWKSKEERSHKDGEARLFTDPGVVDYVSRFIGTLHAPRAEDHIVDATPPGCGGKIALMPSGARNEGYGRRLGAIDWNELYLKYDGYVMFEDLRKQWEILGYDYVLLDSRTGVTDVGGICTRHLPDAVVMMFRPDDQSLAGTADVADAIRNERPAPGRDPVRLHFVMAGIPDADDEHGILEELRRRFWKRLNISKFPPRKLGGMGLRPLFVTTHLLEIRHYQSMDLLQQPIYTRSRPRTKLARSFQALTKRVRRANLNDRDGVLDYLEEPGGEDPDELINDVLDKIHRRYRDDPGVLGGLARWFDGPKSIQLLERIAELGTLSPPQLVMLARSRGDTGDRNGSLRALKSLFREDHTTFFENHPKTDEVRVTGERVPSAVGILATLVPDRAEYIEGSPIMAHLPADERADVAIRLDRSRRERQVGIKILEDVLSSGQGSPAERNSWASELAFARVATGEFARAAEYYRSALSEERTIQDAVGLAMASWGDSRLADVHAFRRVLDVHEEENARVGRRHDVGDRCHSQMEFYDMGEVWWLTPRPRLESVPVQMVPAIALAEWFAGSKEDASRLLEEARQELVELLEGAPKGLWKDSSEPRYAISCWSFTRVPVKKFIEHCDEIRRLFDGDDVKPVFMRDAEEE